MKSLKKKKWLPASLLAALMPFAALAQKVNKSVEMADGLRADGKIYVVVVVMTVIVLGLAFYAFRIDRKVTDLEKKIDADQE